MHDDLQHLTPFLLSHGYLINKDNRHFLPMRKERRRPSSHGEAGDRGRRRVDFQSRKLACIQQSCLGSLGSLGSGDACRRKLISLQPRCKKKYLLVVGNRLTGKEGWSSYYVRGSRELDMTRAFVQAWLKIEGGMPIY